MKVLFTLQHQGYLRNYESTILELASRGHSVQLAFHSQKKQNKGDIQLLEKLVESSPLISCFESALPKRSSLESFLLRGVRGGLDYVRYLAPAYKDALALRGRLACRFPKLFIVATNIFCRMFPESGTKLLSNFFCYLESVFPADKGINDFLRLAKPDVLLVTPLTDFASVQTDYVKSARHMRIHCCLCVHSWDNLSNKGLIRISPDQVFVWNEAQKKEAVEMHDIEPDRVVVTGAQCYDKWYARKPSLSRKEFFHQIGATDSDNSVVLYVCSSPFIASNEVDFVRSWLESIRKDENLKNLSVLIRPHPQNVAQWHDVDLSRFGDVYIWPPKGANPVCEEAKNGYYDSLYYSSAVVGINTSAMIEAGILGKVVLTILADDFKHTQEGTLHFHHLVKGGLLKVGVDLDQHRHQLAHVLLNNEDDIQSVANFVCDFVRPNGVNNPCTPILADAIERAAVSHLLPTLKQPCWGGVLRLLLAGVGLFLSGFKPFKMLTKPAQLKRAMFLKTVQILRFIRLDEFARRLVVASRIIFHGTEEANVTVVNSREKLAELSKGTDSILVGPWISEVGFELLYWIPFLRWFMTEYGIDSTRLIVVSRGGANLWYEGIASTYFDIFEWFTPEEFLQKNQERIRATGGQKHNLLCSFDQEIYALVKNKLQQDRLDWLHPKLMYDLFSDFWRRRLPISLIETHTRYSQYSALPDMKDIELPENFVAMKFYFSSAFPDTPGNRIFVKQLIERVAHHSYVVVLDTGFKVDDHDDSGVNLTGRIISFADKMGPANNLTIQTYILSRAKAFVGTYGGFSYLSPFFGVPSYSFYSSEGKFLPVHLDVAYRAYRSIKHGSFDKLIKNDEQMVGAAYRGKPDFLALNTENWEVMVDLFL